MSQANKSKALFARRKESTRIQIRKKAYGRVRLSVFRSGQHIYAQLIDDSKGVTLAAASTMDKEFKDKKSSSVEGAKAVGEAIAKKAAAVKVKEVVFDRGGYLFHGRVKALADSAREHGLSF
jgi:large subunit ribosomal protein L18